MIQSSKGMGSGKIKRTKIRSPKCEKHIQRLERFRKSIGDFKLFDLPNEPMWYLPLIALSYVYSLFKIYNAIVVDDQTVPGIDFLNVFYTIDIVAIVGYQCIRRGHSALQTSHRPPWVIVLEIISVLPLITLLNHFVKIPKALWAFLEIIHALKLFRICYYLYFNERQLYVKFSVRLITLLACLLIMLFLGFNATFNAICAIDCGFLLSKWVGFRKFIGLITSFGFPTMRAITNVKYLIISAILSSITNFFVMGILMAMTTYDYILMNKHKVTFRNRINMFKNQMIKTGVKSYTIKKIFDFYNKLWQYQYGYVYNISTFNVLQYGLKTELLLDSFCVALKHSNLFRNCDISLARYVSSMMTQRYYCPGELIYEKGDIKDKMIYVVSGIIQIISGEDDQTAILSLSSGTCLGEISLLIPQICTTSVSCESYVEVQILERKNFINCVTFYPEKFKKILNEAKMRYKRAKVFQKVVMNVNKEDDKTDTLTIIWLKDIIQRVLNIKDTTESYNFYNQYELELHKIQSLAFTTRYIDLLVISDKYELNEEAELLQKRFPFIFHPNALLLKIWEAYIIISCVIFMYILPQYIFKELISAGGKNYFRIISYSWAIDLCLQCCTAIIEKGEIHTTIRTIFFYRIQTTSFHLDIIAALPLEILTVITIHENQPFNYLAMYLNRTLKVCHLWRAFSKWENKLHVNISVLAYLRFTLLMIYFVYITSFLLYVSVCKYEPYDCNYNQNYSTVFTAVQIITGVGLIGPFDKKYHENDIFLIAILLAYASFVLMCIFCISGELLSSTDEITLEKMIIELKSVFNVHHMERKYAQRIYNYVDTQWLYNYGSSLLLVKELRRGLPPFLYRSMREDSFFDILRKSPYFQCLPDYIMCDICAVISFDILPANEVVCYAGDFALNMYILGNGICEIIGKAKTYAKGVTILNPLAFAYQVPIVRTCITKTNCFLIVLNYKDLIKLLYKYPDMKPLFGISDSLKRYYTEAIQKHILYDTSLHKVVPVKPWSFYHFGYKIKEGSIAMYDYYIPFVRLHKLRCVRYLLMRTTINPNGKFFLVYEILRSCLAFLSVVIHTSYYVIVSEQSFWKWLMISFDIMAYIDIYIRMHICYYNEEGILVKHPLSTATYYLTHDFILDFCACLPLEIIFIVKNHTMLLCFHCNRLLQMRRYWQVTDYLGNRHVEPKSKWCYFRLFPIIILASLFMGSFVLTTSCVLDSSIKNTDSTLKDIYEDGITCEMDYWLTKSKFSKPISPLRAQMYSWYIVTSSITTIGMQGFVLHTQAAGLVTAIFSVIGFYLSVCILCKHICYGSAISDVFSLYQALLGNLQKCLKRRHITTRLQQLIINHNDLRWQRQRGKDIISLMQNFHYSLQQDILYYIYGHAIFENSIFPPGGMKLIRNLLMFTTHETFLKGANIIRVNDVNKLLHIIYRGSVNVVAVDGTVLEELQVSSMFGNLDGQPYVRQKMNFIAKSVVEVLSIDSVVFYRVINDYPILKPIFMLTTERFVHYFPSKQNRKVQKKNYLHDEEIEQQGLCANLLHEFHHSVFYPDSNFIKTWQTFNFIVCYISVCLYLFQLALSEFNFYYVLIQYICDAICIIDFYINDHLAYENESGELVVDLKQIRKNKRKNKFKYVVSIGAVVPIHLVLFVLPLQSNADILYNLFKLLRLNRMYRIKSIVQYFKIYDKKITSNVYLVQISALFLYFFLALMFICCITIWICTFFENNMNVHVETNMFVLPASKKVELLMFFLFNVICAVGRIAQSNEFPNAPPLIALYAIQMTIYLYVWGLLYSQICIVIFKNETLKTLCREKVSGLWHFIEKEDISECIARKLIRFINLLWLRYEGFIYPYLLKHAPLYIEEAILGEKYFKYINGNIIFKKCHKDFNRQLVCKLTVNIFSSEDYITFKDSIDGCMYIIHKGCVEVLDEDEKGNETSIGTLNTGNWFGILQGLSNKTRHKYTYRAKTFSSIFYLKYDNWSYLLEFFPATRAIIFQEMKLMENDTDAFKY